MSQVKLTADSGGGTTSLKGPSATTGNADVVLKLPVADGSANQVLKTDGSGQLSFTSNAGTTINNNADNRVITGSGTASTLNGESNVVIDGSGQLGVGTTSPVAPFHVAHSGTSTAVGTNFISLRSGASGRDIGIQFADGATSAYVGMLGGAIYFADSGSSEKMRIDSAGRVGIGDTSPDRELVVKNASSNSTIKIEASNTSTSQLIFSDSDVENVARIALFHGSGADQNTLNFETAGTSRLAITSAGKVGIGTISPNTLLHIRDAAISQGYSSQSSTLLALEDSGDTSLEIASGHNNTSSVFFGDTGASQKGQINYHNGTGGDAMSFHANGSERMRIVSDGKIGIGRTDPVNFVDIARGSDEANILVVRGADNTSEYGAIGVDSGNMVITGGGAGGVNTGMVFRTAASGTETERMRIDSSGSVLIGTTSGGNTGSYFQADNNDRRTLNVASSSTAAQNQIIFRNPNDRVGTIQTSGTSTSYNTTFSDIASKKNFENWTEDVLSLFKNINPQKFNFKVEDDSASKSKGFIAQEMVDKFPEAYVKQEDEMYMFNPSGMAVYLMKALQESVVKIEALETKVAALEAA